MSLCAGIHFESLGVIKFHDFNLARRNCVFIHSQISVIKLWSLIMITHSPCLGVYRFTDLINKLSLIHFVIKLIQGFLNFQLCQGCEYNTLFFTTSYFPIYKIHTSRISHGLWFNMIYIRRVVGFQSTQRIGYKSYQVINHRRFFLSHICHPIPAFCLDYEAV
jgi:hypothetical protein